MSWWRLALSGVNEQKGASVAGPPAAFVSSGGRALSHACRARDRAAGQKGSASRPMRVTIPPAASRRRQRAQQRPLAFLRIATADLALVSREGSALWGERKLSNITHSPRAIVPMQASSGPGPAAGKPIPRRSLREDCVRRRLSGKPAKPAPPLAFRPVCDGCLRRRAAAFARRPTGE